MRLTSELIVSALTRRVFGEGGFAAVLRKGAAEAGAIYVLARGRAGEVALYGPAAQASYGEERPAERRFVLISTDEDKIAVRLDKEARFDPDFWTVEIEPARTPVEELISIQAPD